MSADGWLSAATMIRAFAVQCRLQRSGVSRPQVERMGMVFEALVEFDKDAFRVWFDQRLATALDSLALIIEKRGQQEDTPVEVRVVMEP